MDKQFYKQLGADTLIPGPAIPGHRVECASHSRFLFLNKIVVPCTPIEYKLLYFFLHHYQQSIMSEELIQLFDSIALDHPASLLRARKRLTKLLSELRVKIWGSGLTIVAEYGVGYRLDTQS